MPLRWNVQKPCQRGFLNAFEMKCSGTLLDRILNLLAMKCSNCFFRWNVQKPCRRWCRASDLWQRKLCLYSVWKSPIQNPIWILPIFILFQVSSCTDLGADQGTSGSLKHRDTCAWCTGGTWHHHQLVHHHHHHHHHQLVQPGDQRSGRVGAAGVDRGSRRAEGTDVYCFIFEQNMCMTPNFV